MAGNKLIKFLIDSVINIIKAKIICKIISSLKYFLDLLIKEKKIFITYKFTQIILYSIAIKM